MKDGKHGFIKIFTGVLAIFGVNAMLSGCTLSAGAVKLHTKEEMQAIVDQRYGEAELISMEDDKDVNKRSFTYRDKKYGFTYQVVSRPNSVGMDGSTFYYDGASAMFYYEEPFLAYFKEQEEPVLAKRGIAYCDSLDFEDPSGGIRKFSLKSKMLFSTTEKWKEDMQFVWDLIQEYASVPELIGNQYKLKVYDTDQRAFVGILSEDGFVTAESLEIEYYMEQAESIAQIHGIEYVRTEKKRVSEVPGLAEQEMYENDVKRYDLKVKVFYFTYEGKEYFIVDQWVAQELESEGIGGIFQYYQNYKHYDISK